VTAARRDPTTARTVAATDEGKRRIDAIRAEFDRLLAAERGVGEIGVLERSFNTMARSLQDSREELAASRARIVAAGDRARRRIERDLHDGIQQRLVSLVLDLRTAEGAVPSELHALRGQLARVAEGLAGALDELRELSRGIHPAILSEGGLPPALKALARRSVVPVELDVHVQARLPEQVEVAAYYVVSEALANAAKHAHASVAHVEAQARDGRLHLSVRDDGVGGAVPVEARGSSGSPTGSRRWAGRSRSTARPGRAPRCWSTSPSTSSATDGHARGRRR
jgi:signal transduction histidine kinase